MTKEEARLYVIDGELRLTEILSCVRLHVANISPDLAADPKHAELISARLARIDELTSDYADVRFRVAAVKKEFEL